MASLWLFTCARAMGAPTVMRWTPAGSLGGKWQMVTLGPGDASATSPGDKPTGIEHGIWYQEPLSRSGCDDAPAATRLDRPFPVARPGGEEPALCSAGRRGVGRD